MNTNIQFTISTTDQYILLEFKIQDGVISPEDLMKIDFPDFVKQNLAHKGVILSGRGPVWLYGAMIHYYHPMLWVATNDPRQGGAVIVQSHTKDKTLGEIVPFNNQE